MKLKRIGKPVAFTRRIQVAFFVLLMSLLSISRNSVLIRNGSSSQESKQTVQKKGASAVRSKSSQSEECPSDHVFFQNKVLPEEITHISDKKSRIPKIIHFFVKSKCLPTEIADNMHHWTSVSNHSVYIHDEKEIREYLSRERNDLPYLSKYASCAFTQEVFFDIARILFLYDQGGISVDIDYIPGPEFFDGDMILGNHQTYQKAWQFLIDDDSEYPQPRFIASEAKHLALHMILMASISRAFLQLADPSFTYDYKNDIYRVYGAHITIGKDHKTTILERYNEQGVHTCTVFPNRMEGDMLTKLNFNNITKESIKFTGSSEGCAIDLSNDSYEVDVGSLHEVAGWHGHPDNGTCPDGQIYISNTFLPESIVKGRKIPKIIHMTSKGRCFTKAFADNADKWRLEGHSFFLHDDAAVDRLFDREWPEFPLLKHVRSCLSSGAGLADLWRYLVLWEFGGVYTDMDDAPGKLDNGTMIADDIDALFEVERGGFPSQYYFAVSPHHPISFFMVNFAIESLITIGNSIKKQYVPFVTGPGAVKRAMMSQIGEGYPKKGTYSSRVNNRSITMLDPKDVKRGSYHMRDFINGNIKSEGMEAMNMPHYSNKKGKLGKTHSCYIELYNQTMFNVTF